MLVGTADDAARRHDGQGRGRAGVPARGIGERNSTRDALLVVEGVVQDDDFRGKRLRGGAANGAGCPVAVAYRCGGASGRVVLGERRRVTPSDDLLHGLRNAFGAESVRVGYPDR